MSGYRQPPAQSRFTKGQSSNPKGRPRGRHATAPYDAVLGQIVTVRNNGIERKVTASEAFLLQITKRGLDGDSQAARITMAAIEEARARNVIESPNPVTEIVFQVVEPGSVTSALILLKMARKLDRYRETAKVKLEPWLVEAALERLQGGSLSPAEQAEIYRATRTPRKVVWPEWWVVRD